MQTDDFIRLVKDVAKSGKSAVRQVSGGVVVVVADNSALKLALIKPINDQPLPARHKLISAVASGNGHLSQLGMARVWAYQCRANEPDRCTDYVQENFPSGVIAVPVHTPRPSTNNWLGLRHSTNKSGDGGHPIRMGGW